jgi:predicted lipoprotein with Yx(FWY)xxD motif
MRKTTRVGKISISLVSICLVILAGCSPIAQQIQSVTGGNKTPAAGGAYGAAAPTSQAAIPVTGGPSVTVNDQTTDGTSVVVAKVISKGPGWIAIHNQQNGQTGVVIGYSPVKDGENDNVTVKIDAGKVTPTLYAMLHIDAGVVGTYEFPGPDVPYMTNGQMVSPSFNISRAAGTSQTPMVTVHDQDASSGKVIVDDVVSNGPGWVDIHISNPDGSMGQEIGYTAVHDGDNRNVTITIDAKKATATMQAMLHIDAGTPGLFDTGADKTVMLNGQMVGSTFKNTTGQTANQAPTDTPGTAAAMPGMDTTPAGQASATPAAGNAQPSATPMPANSQPTASTAGMAMATPSGTNKPSLKVSDQQIQNGTVKIDDVVSSGPGWVVVYTVTNGQPDQLIGYTHVNDGDNPNVIVKIDTTKPVDNLYALYHVDAGKIGTFEYPGPDVPMMVGVQMIAGLFKTSTSAANGPKPAAPVPFIAITNQAIHNGAVVASHVVAVGEAWVTVHQQNPDGTVGNLIGATAVHDGTTDNVVIHIDTRRATRTLFAMLHVNASKAATPQFPGVDMPVLVGGKMVLPAFVVNGPLNGDVPLMINKNNPAAPYLTDGVGMALYISLNDQPGKSNCTGDCLTQWHPLLANGSIVPGDGISWTKLGVIILPDNTRQITYNGAPVYYYTGDKNPGDTSGQGLAGNWFLVTP